MVSDATEQFPGESAETALYSESWTSRAETPSTAGETPRLAPAPSVSNPGRTNAARFINRELSWLAFTSRVLALAENRDRPLLERVKFVAINGQNLDEFFQIRVAGLHEQRALGAVPPPDHMAVTTQLAEIRAAVIELQRRQSRLLNEELLPALRENGITIIERGELEHSELEWLHGFFDAKVFRVLTPLAVDPAHPFPYISSLSLNLAVLLRDSDRGRLRFARVKVPPILPRFVVLPGGSRLIRLEDVVALHLDRLFPGKTIVSHHTFRITRNADLDIAEDEAEDLLLAIESQIQRRGVFADVVRLEVEKSISDHVLSLLTRELELRDDDVYRTDGIIDAASLFALHALDRPDLKADPRRGITPRPFDTREGAGLFAAIRAQDVLVHHPYESFTGTFEAFIEAAVTDPSVLAIKQTLYRTSSRGGLVEALIRAAEAGKQVVALIELRARFDERANITWARKLEESGVHVVYGVVGLKTHAKLCLVVRNEEDEIRRYVHIGTGNYNATTARIYEDIGLFSADEDLAADVSDLFNHLTGYSDQAEWRRLLVAPAGLRTALLRRIEREAARPGGEITMKVNSLVDPEMIDALYAASKAGTTIRLIVRGVCSLRPGVLGLSETITVRSLVGRYLEHSRIFRFGRAGDPATDYFIGSADLMSRNLDRRVEALVPVADPRLRERLDEILELCLADNQLAWSLGAEERWIRVLPTGDPLDAQSELGRRAAFRASD